MQKLEDFKPGTSFLGWMGKFVRYTALNEVRRRRSHPAGSLDLSALPAAGRGEDGPAVGVTAGGVPVEGAFDRRVVRALGTLEETARACLLLKVVLDLPYRQIAAALDIPEGTAMSHVHRARKALRAILSQGGQADPAPTARSSK